MRIEKSRKNKVLINWQYCNDLNDINEAISTQDPDWEGLRSAKDIISITYNTDHGCYVVIWRLNPESRYSNTFRGCSNCTNAVYIPGFVDHYCNAKQCGIETEVYDCPVFEGEYLWKDIN